MFSQAELMHIHSAADVKEYNYDIPTPKAKLVAELIKTLKPMDS